MSEVKESKTAVQDILTDSIQLMSGFPKLDSAKCYNDQATQSASSSMSCLSLPAGYKRQSKIPLPNSVNKKPTLMREKSSPALTVNSKLSLKPSPPKVPPKPTHLKLRRDLSLQPQSLDLTQNKTMLKRESSAPPANNKTPQSPSFAWRPPRPNVIRREASFDSLASSNANSSRIPVWRGSQDRLNRGKNKKMWESCAEVRFKIKFSHIVQVGL